MARIPLTAGVDEAGRGCLAGPVVAAAVILPKGYKARLPGLTDSKLLTEKRRGELALTVKSISRAWAIGVSWPREIEACNILHATKLAMGRAVLRLKLRPERLQIDGNQTILLEGFLQEAVVDGDRRKPVISAASVVAKVFRDHLMTRLDRRYPGYGFAEHKGYGTRAHRLAIRRLGPCHMHRATFQGVREEPPSQENLCLPGLDT
ncbi:ribonuclease HII [Desulfohalovibrio reitneri]|uniref:ribonuclease HII n=1 Tax=Desulfohalovibrio reitneri TaxID=1307759 RepID=UPI0004A77EDC|nr:ribonuclease HII [Desulfohalovibrio reitneri]